MKMRRRDLLTVAGAAAAYAALPHEAEALTHQRLVALGSKKRAPYLGFVATRCGVAHRQNVALSSICGRTAHVATDNIVAIKLLSGNWFVDEDIIGGSGGTYLEKGTGSSQTRTASIEYPAGTINRIKWSGATSILETSGQNNVLSDWCSVSIPKGATFWSCENVSGNTSGIAFLTGVGNNEFDVVDGDKTRLDGTDSTGVPGASWTDGGSYGTGQGATGGYGIFPLGLLATTQRGSVMAIGSSRTEGIYDTANTHGMGITCRALGDLGVGYVNAGVSGDSHARFIASHANRLTLAAYCSHVLIEGPTNDVLTIEATVEANIQTILGYFAGKKRLLTTCDTETSSTDNWKTVANQTVTKDFTTVNSYIRSHPSNCDGVIDLTAVTMTSNKWNADGSTAKLWTYDGTHEQAYACQHISASGIMPASMFA